MGGGNLASKSKKKGFAISGILYPLLILTLFLVVQILFMMQTRKNVLDKSRKELSDSVNASNIIYNNEELSTLAGDQKKMIDELTEKVTVIESENSTLKSNLTTLNTSMGNYVLKNQIKDPHNKIAGSIMNIYDGGYAKDLFGRETNGTPGEYKINEGAIYSEFKDNLSIGIPSGVYRYSVLLTFSFYGYQGDYSGGRPFQIAFSNGKMYMRNSTGDTTWGSWNTLH